MPLFSARCRRAISSPRDRPFTAIWRTLHENERRTSDIRFVDYFSAYAVSPPPTAPSAVGTPTSHPWRMTTSGGVTGTDDDRRLPALAVPAGAESSPGPRVPVDRERRTHAPPALPAWRGEARNREQVCEPGSRRPDGPTSRTHHVTHPNPAGMPILKHAGRTPVIQGAAHLTAGGNGCPTRPCRPGSGAPTSRPGSSVRRHPRARSSRCSAPDP